MYNIDVLLMILQSELNWKLSVICKEYQDEYIFWSDNYRKDVL